MNSDINPYQVPQADIAVEARHPFHEPRRLPSRHGIDWITQAWHLFKVSPLKWIGMMLLMYLITAVGAMIPLPATALGEAGKALIGQLYSSLITPILSAGLYAAARRAHSENTVRVGDLFLGLQERAGTLALVGLLTVALSTAVILAAALLVGLAIGFNPLVLTQAPSLTTLILISAIVGAALFPIIMASWYAAPLVYFEGLSPLNALRTSFMGCLRNVMPFTVYSLVALLVFVLGLLPLGLGLLIALPVLMLTGYASYFDIFMSHDQGSQS